MIDTTFLRAKVLDLAVRGKLLPQCPSDEPAKELLKRIKAEKEALIKAGKIKRDKNESEIIKKAGAYYEKRSDTLTPIDDEIPFSIPDSWEWVRLGDIFQHNTGKALNSSDTTGNKLTYITTSNLYWDRFEIKSLKEMRFSDAEIDKCTVTKGDLLVCEGGDIGRSAIWNYDFDMRIQNHIHRLRPYYSICTRFFYYTFYLYKNSGLIGGNGIGIQGLSSNALHNLLFPFPPLAEQRRIVEALSEIMECIGCIEKGKKELEELVSLSRAKILDLAVQGKLLPQDPNDEPAKELLKKIRAEKEALIKAGKIKRDKNESEIIKKAGAYYEKRGDTLTPIDDEIPFPIPEGWTYSTLREITTPLELNDGDWILSDNMDPNGSVKLLQLGSIGYMKYIDKGFKYLTEETFVELGCTEIHSDYLLINRIISDRMCCCIIPNISGKVITTVDTCWIAPHVSHYNLKYLMYLMASPAFQKMVNLKALGTTRKRISKNNLLDLPIPLPPLAEQRRIVEKIESAFSAIASL